MNREKKYAEYITRFTQKFLQSNSNLNFSLIREFTPFSLAARLFMAGLINTPISIFVVVVDTLHYDEIMTQRRELAGTLGHLLHAFTGEHVGEPRLLICLYGPELLHVDLKFVTLEMLTQRVEEPAVLFTRDNTALQRQLAKFSAHWPDMTPEWFESRARIWLHYAVVKLGRGELFEAIGMLSFFREQVLGPMLYRRANLPQRGVRHIEFHGIDPDGLLTSTLATHDRDSVSMAIRMAVDAYINLRADALPENIADDAARWAVLAMLKAYSDRGLNLYSGRLHGRSKKYQRSKSQNWLS